MTSEDQHSANTRGYRDDDRPGHYEALWGGPSGPGLVWTVERLAEAVRNNSEILMGTGSTEGIVHKVSSHDEFIQVFRDNQKWALRLLAGQLLAIIVAGGYVVAKMAMGG